MKELLAFLYRSRNVFIFLFLEFLCFLWITQSNTYQRQSWLHTASYISGSILSVTSSVTAYFDSYRQNLILTEENARLKALLQQRQPFLIPDTLFSALPYSPDSITAYDTSLPFTFIPSQIINNTSSNIRADNYITLNVGSDDGVISGMGVVGPKGIIGRINSTTDHYSTAKTVLHTKFSTGAIILPLRVKAILQWNGEDMQIAELLYVEKQHQINVGDSVVTYDRSIYPSNYYIGKVEAVDRNKGGNYQEINIRLSTDFSTLRYAYVVKFSDRSELDSLWKMDLEENEK